MFKLFALHTLGGKLAIKWKTAISILNLQNCFSNYAIAINELIACNRADKKQAGLAKSEV